MDTGDSKTKPLVFDPYKYKIRWYENPRLLRYLFGILMVATLVSIFELLFVYFISVPETDKSVSALFPEVPEDPPIFKQIESAEKSDREMKNRYLIFNYSVVIAVMVFLLYYVYNKMVQDQKKVQVFGHNFRATLLQSLFSVLVLASFQVFFFQFARKSALVTDAELQYATAKGTLEGTNAELAKR